MKRRFLPLLTLLALAASLTLPVLTRAQGTGTVKPSPPHRPASGESKPVDPNKPVPGKFTSPKLRGWVNDVPDTGQFLPDSVVLLRVGPRVTTVANYVESWFTSYPEYRPAPDSAGRVQFLNSLMHKDVLGMTALALNRPLGYEDRIALREARQRALANAVQTRYVRDSVVVTDAEVRTLWEGFKWLQHFRHILVLDRITADRVRRELVSGHVTWAVAVKKYSVSKNDMGPDGELGWVSRDKMDPNLAYWVYGLKPGETSQPVEDRDGWHIVQSIERKPVDPPSFEPMAGVLKGQIGDIKAGALSERLLALLRVQTEMVYDSANVLYASGRFQETMKYQPQAMSSSIEIDGTVPEFSPTDTTRLLAHWKNGGRYSLGDLLHAYSDIPPLLRPSLNRAESMFGFVEATVLEPYIAEYGAQNGLEKDPIVAVPMQKKLEELMVEHMYQDSVFSKVWVSKDERKAYYQKNLRQFFTYPSVRFAAITRDTKAGTDSVEKALKSGMKAEALLAADSAQGRVSGSIQVRGQNENGPYQKALFEEMRPGGIQVRGPDKNGDYIIIQLLDYDGGRQLTFEESEQMIDESLQNQKSEKALDDMIARLKKRYAVAMRPDLLMLVKLVDPAID
jgi:hypothetical protein